MFHLKQTLKRVYAGTGFKTYDVYVWVLPNQLHVFSVRNDPDVKVNEMRKWCKSMCILYIAWVHKTRGN